MASRRAMSCANSSASAFMNAELSAPSSLASTSVAVAASSIARARERVVLVTSCLCRRGVRCFPPVLITNTARVRHAVASEDKYC
eukprot:scaffold10703_cov72-Phaeocystis_antarctica.AAC.2